MARAEQPAGTWGTRCAVRRRALWVKPRGPDPSAAGGLQAGTGSALESVPFLAGFKKRLQILTDLLT